MAGSSPIWRNSSTVRWVNPRARGWMRRSGWRSTRSSRTPCQLKKSAVDKPVSPPPAIRTGVVSSKRFTDGVVCSMTFISPPYLHGPSCGQGGGAVTQASVRCAPPATLFLTRNISYLIRLFKRKAWGGLSNHFADRESTVAALDRALRETSAQSVLFSQAVADHVGMNPTDLESLDILARYGPMTAGRLAELTGLTTGAITGLVDRLESRGYARREPHPTDRRSVVVRPLIDNAERDLAPSYAAMSKAMDELVSRYSDDELAVIADFMSRAAAVTAEQITKVRDQSTEPRA